MPRKYNRRRNIERMLKVDIIKQHDAVRTRLNRLNCYSKAQARTIVGLRQQNKDLVNEIKVLNRQVKILSRQPAGLRKQLAKWKFKVFEQKKVIKQKTKRIKWLEYRIKPLKDHKRYIAKEPKPPYFEDNLRRTVNTIIQYEELKKENPDLLTELLFLNAGFQNEYFKLEDLIQFFGSKPRRSMQVTKSLVDVDYLQRTTSRNMYITEFGKTYLRNLISKITRFKTRLFHPPII